jgi:hypothetical protein
MNIFLVILMVAAQPTPIAFFEGSVTLYRYKPDPVEGKTGERTVMADISASRIRISGLQTVEPTGIFRQIKATDLIIRNDKQDFVFLTSDKTAIVMTKQEVQAISMLVAMSRRTGDRNLLTVPDLKWTDTGRTRRIQNLPTREWTAQMADMPLGAKLWFSEQFRISWGMLAEPWVADAGIAGLLPIQTLFGDGQSPLRVETYRQGALFEVIEFTRVLRRPAAQLALDIPAGFAVLSFQELMSRQAGNGR